MGRGEGAGGQADRQAETMGFRKRGGREGRERQRDRETSKRADGQQTEKNIGYNQETDRQA